MHEVQKRKKENFTQFRQNEAHHWSHNGWRHPDTSSSSTQWL